MQDQQHAGNIVLLRGGALWLLMALVLAWCMVAINFGIKPVDDFFEGRFSRILQAHIDFLLMTALILGFYAAKIPLAWHVRWSMVIGAFTNSSLFLLMAIFSELDSPTPENTWLAHFFQIYLLVSISITTYGFGAAAITVLRSTLRK